MITARLSAFACAPVTGADEALRVMRLSLADWAACGIAGRAEPVAQATRALALDEAGQPQATLIGGGRVPARAAALVNGATSHALDYDDTHFDHIGHTSVAVIPAALAVAERQGADGAAFLQACLVGSEVAIRAGTWLGRAHYQAGFHQTATSGAFGAAAAAGRLMGLDAGAMAMALGIVSTRAAGLKSQFGTMGKPYNAGIAAASGVEAAQLAARGMVSTPQALEAFGAAHAGEALDAALDGLGESWRFRAVSHKFHACCHGLHAMIEALGSLGPVVPGLVQAITVTTHPRWLKVCNQPAPQTGLGAKFSYRLVAAMVLAGHNTAALQSYSDEACANPTLVALRDRVTVETDDRLPDTAARVRLTFADKVLEAAHDIATPEPLSTRTARLRAKIEALVGPGDAAALMAATDPLPDLPALLALLSRR